MADVLLTIIFLYLAVVIADTWREDRIFLSESYGLFSHAIYASQIMALIALAAVPWI